MAILPFGVAPIKKTAVTPGTYTATNLTVNAYGQITAAANGSGGGGGTVTSVSVVTANGVSGSVATASTTPAITLTLGAITPTTVNGLTITSSTGTLTVVNGKTLKVDKTLEFDGTDSTKFTFPGSSDTVATLTASQAFTNKDLTDATNTFPTFNQNTTGSAAKWTTARNLAGNSVDGSANVAFANKFVVQGTVDAGLSAAQFLGALGTGIVKNTTTTGVLSIAVNTDLPVGDATHSGAMPTPPNNTTTFLRGDATFATLPAAGTVTTVSVVTANGISGSVSNPTTTPAITLTLGAITPTTVNGVTISGSSTPTLAVTGTSSISGANTGDQTITLTSDVTGSGTGSFATTIRNDVALGGNPTTTTQSLGDSSTKIATTAFVASAILGQNFKEAARVATTGNLIGTYLLGVFTYTATGTDAIDGVTLALNDRVLVKNQTDNTQNGIYKVTTAGAIGIAGVLTRATDANQSGEFKTGDSIFITAGTTQTSTTWAYTGADSPAIGTDAITYAQIAGQGSFSAGNGITITGTSIAIDTSITVDKTTAQVLTNKDMTSGTNSWPTFNQNTTGSAAKLTTARNIGGVSFDGTASITVATATGGFTVSGGDLAIGANNLTITGSIGSTGSRVTKGWFTDLQVTNAISGSVTGSAATWTTARNLAGNSVNGSANVAFSNSFIVQGTADTGLSGAQFLGALGTGIVKNTTTTGVLSIAVANDFPTLNQNTSGTAAGLSATLVPASGGTGVANNNSSTITISGSFATTLTVSATTSVTLPTSGTLATLANTETLTNKLLSDAFMGNSFNSQSALVENVTLLASSNFTYDNLLEIGASNTLEIPATSTLEVEAYIDQAYTNNTLGVAPDANNSFVSQSPTTMNIVLPQAIDFLVANLLEINVNYVVEIPRNSSLEIAGYSTSANLRNDQFYNPYKFRVHLNTGQTISSNAFTKVPFDTVDFDTSSNFDAVTNHRFTAPINGFYQFNSTVENNSGSGARALASIYKNGVEYSRGNDLATSAQALASAGISDLVPMVAGDYVEIYFLTSGTNIAGTSNDSAPVTYFSGFLVSKA